MRRRCASGCSPTATRSGDGGADVAVVNTCCVTHEALRKSRHAASRAARTHGRVYVTGCGANLSADAFAGPAARTSSSSRGRARRRRPSSPGDVGAIGCVQADARLDRVRAFVKVQDGCSFSCNFCVIPLVRGASRSRRADAVLAEIRRRVEQGHREVVLTGINLGCYRDREARLRPAATGPRGRRDARARAPAALVDRGQPPDDPLLATRCARRRRCRATCTSRSSRATTASCARWRAGTTSRDVPAPGRARRRTST